MDEMDGMDRCCMRCDENPEDCICGTVVGGCVGGGGSDHVAESILSCGSEAHEVASHSSGLFGVWSGYDAEDAPSSSGSDLQPVGDDKPQDTTAWSTGTFAHMPPPGLP